MKRTLLLFSFLILSAGLSAQTGGGYVYQFLNVPASARVAALGGTFISVKDNDLNAALHCPSLLNSSMSKQLSFSGVSYFDGVKFGEAAYAQDFGKLGTFLADMHFASYGQFQETDVYGNINGTFRAADYALQLGWGYQFAQKLSVGAALKTIYSDYYLYNAFGVALDLGGTFYDSITQWTITAEIKNVGVQLKNYVKDNNEPLPAEGLIAFSKRLAHTPLRFNLTYRHLEKFDLSYDDPLNVGDVDPLTGVAEPKTISFGDKLSRHFIIGAEILLSKNFHINGGYNFQRRRELAVDSRKGTVGFSFGVSLKISKFILGYGLANYHLAGAANHFSITTNLAEFGRK
jgi:hypothetical protein